MVMKILNKEIAMKYSENYLVLDCKVYPKAFIRIYRTEDDALIRSIHVKWEKRYEAFKELYNKYVRSLNENR